MSSLHTAQTSLPHGIVTFLFTDIEGSTRMACELGEDYRHVLHEHRRLLRQVFGRYTGAELLTEGDSFFVAFDDAGAALDAALWAQRALAAHEWPRRPSWRGPAMPRVRMGVHTGYAVPDEQGYATSVVHRAARVCSAAHGGQILCSQAAMAAAKPLPPSVSVLDLGLHALRGFDDTERLLQVSVDDLPRHFPPPAAQPRRHNLIAAPDEFIGRNREIADLTRLLRGHRLVSVTALPRTGRTRLITEVARRGLDHYADGVWFADLTGGENAEAIAAAVGVRTDPFRPAADAVIEALRSRRCLLVLDNAADGDAPLITRLLHDCPDVTILTAAQRPLGLTGEIKWAMPSMSLPDAARVLRHMISCRSGGEDPGDCTELAAVVDGFLPALPVLARACSVLGAGTVRSRMRDDPLAVLDSCGDLSRVLGAVYEQLSELAARMLRQLSARDTPVGLDEVERWCGGTAASLNALIDLVDCSLVDVVRLEARAVYRLPAPVRWFADRKRRRAGEPAHHPARATTGGPGPVPTIATPLPNRLVTTPLPRSVIGNAVT